MKNIKTKATALVATLLPVAALAESQDPGTIAAEKINALIPGIAAVGSAILGVTLAIVGWLIISRLVKRGS